MPNEAYLTTWNTYQAAWSDISSDQRLQLLKKSVAEDAIYTDPQSECHGLTELTAKIEQSQKAYPGASFHNEKALDHHKQGLFTWKMHDVEDKVIAVGTSYARFGDDGLLTQMSGFFELV